MKKLKILVVLIITLGTMTVWAQNRNAIHLTQEGKVLSIKPSLEIYYQSDTILPLAEELFEEYALMQKEHKSGILKTKVEKKEFSYRYYIFALSGLKTYQEWIVEEGVIVDSGDVTEPFTYPALWMITALIGVLIIVLSRIFNLDVDHYAFFATAAACFLTCLLMTQDSLVKIGFTFFALCAVFIAVLIFLFVENKIKIKKNQVVLYFICMILYIIFMYFAF